MKIFTVGRSKSFFFKLLLNIGLASQTNISWFGREKKTWQYGQGLGSGQEDKLAGVEWGGGQPGCAATTSASSAACQAKAGCKEWGDMCAAPARGAPLTEGNF